jgi:hypothetical protein
MYKYFVFLILGGCGSSQSSKIKNPTLEKEVIEQVERLEKLIIWCDDYVVSPSNNNLTGKPNCGGGDSMYWNGFVSMFNSSLRNKVQIGFEKSFNWTTLFPYRHPSYVGINKEDEFSRDQLLGLTNSLLFSSLDLKNKVISVFNNFYNTNKLCEHPTDNKCDFTNSSMLGVKYFFGESMSVSELLVDKATVIIEAQTVSKPYQRLLVAQKIFFRYFTGQGNYKTASNILVNKDPSNIYFKFVQKMVHGEILNYKNELLQELLTCMKQFKTPSSDALWEHHSDCSRGMGWESSSLSRYLIEGNFEIKKIGDLTNEEINKEP